LFDVIHKNYDNQINIKWNVQKHNMKVLNAQFLSRYGFTIEEVKDKEAEVLAAIDARGVEIGEFAHISHPLSVASSLPQATQTLCASTTRDGHWKTLLATLE
jgi:hypothetical protein